MDKGALFCENEKVEAGPGVREARVVERVVQQSFSPAGDEGLTEYHQSTSRDQCRYKVQAGNEQ